VFRRTLHYVGNYFSLIYKKFNEVYSYVFYKVMLNNLALDRKISGISHEISVTHFKPEQRE